MSGPTPRWTPLRWHAEQQRLHTSPARFKIVPAGRRSGKTELCKRAGVMHAIRGIEAGLPARVVFSAPTNDQAVSIFWEDVQALVPAWCRDGEASQSKRMIRLANGSTILVCGLDRPQRIEGSPVDWIAIDEVADLRAGAWEKHVRPMLDTDGRPGQAWLLGVPEGRNHYWRLYQRALEERARLGDASEWDVFHWKSAEILDPAVIAKARADLDDLTFAQEYEASFVTFAGRAYYPFDRQRHAATKLQYRHGLPLVFCFDFNVEPGVAVVAQDQIFDTSPARDVPTSEAVSCAIGEVWIPRNSNTPAVCRKLIADWNPENGARAKHRGDVWLFGDATGGNRGTAKVAGSDWDLIRAEFRSVRGWNVVSHVEEANPLERSRVNAVNSRLLAADGRIRTLVDPVDCPRLIDDFEGVVLLAGGSGEIEKDHRKSPERTHISDAWGYFVAKRHPVVRHVLRQQQL